MRVARFAGDDDPRFGVVGTEGDTPIIAPLKGDPLYAPLELTGEKLALEDVRLLAPVIPRSKVVCVGKNYVAHAAEMGGDVPEEPLIFLKPNTSVIGPGEPIFYPKQSQNVHFEGELAIVIGRICRNLTAEDAPKVIYGYTVANDVTARDLQKKDGQWARAKGFDTFCPLGPWIETDFDPSDVRVRTTLNGETKQDGRTSDMVFDVTTILQYVTSFMTLLPGDVVLTGTPDGVGPMVAGDDVAVTIDGLGTLTNPVVADE
ncbi:fumarylacetoacetate hydrolase family protein [Aeromicrobium tamlense]|uniref:2-keto-4-pentenoate hydratase/2-oxohepta-3-ene-1,7-dioic acid hydratase in catechol pathway n=1 Tax=Aeromicrobium tamlense TaxID=375541 RepID=A0A8I0KFU7_9ACTN|nr:MULTISPECIES: fumarylacetoacetate hydrolase family protein [Aeromicrobium]MBD1268716.1 fumarylacetoacetate hydrolase family protein [Aeromicrobium tamlense]NYI37378.1 2-keto-4-pentenoate hydratase/2-oxohepta-3-ene-1,7-dioic acid hydratase in catechol pathway [Aeromicrobium tamlense]